jgi:hypothetical protein
MSYTPGCTHYQWTCHRIPDGTLYRMCVECGLTSYNLEDFMAKQQKRAVEIHKITNPRYGYTSQWTHNASPTAKNPNPGPYTVSLANDGNGSCACMNWTRTHPRADCRHIMGVKLREAVPLPVKSEPKMQFVQASGRVFRD